MKRKPNWITLSKFFHLQVQSLLIDGVNSTSKVHWNWREISLKIAIQGKNNKKGEGNEENTKTLPKIDQINH